MQRTEIQRLFKQYYAKMLRVARSILYDEQESEDVICNIFENLLREQTILMPDTEERYLMTSVRNQCLKSLRHEEVKRHMEALATAEQYSGIDRDDERLADIDEFVARHLTTQEQRIFRLRFTDGCSYEDIAAAEDISRVAVWKHLSHALSLIKTHFNQ